MSDSPVGEVISFARHQAAKQQIVEAQRERTVAALLVASQEVDKLHRLDPDLGR
jgi:hypothetical protein